MSEKQNPGLEKDNSSPASNDEPKQGRVEERGSYYYDDATGYEIYQEETVTDEEAEDPA